MEWDVDTWYREQEDTLYPAKESGPNSHDVWEGAAHASAWLGYVEREHVDGLGMMWSAYRAHHYHGQAPANTGVFVDHYDTPEEASDAVRAFWEDAGN